MSMDTTYCDDCGLLYDPNDGDCMGCELTLELKTVKHYCREAINTTWRFIGVYEGKIDIPIKLALKSAKFHLTNADHIFEDK